jgi:hypothetical protein
MEHEVEKYLYLSEYLSAYSAQCTNICQDMSGKGQNHLAPPLERWEVIDPTV